MNLLRFGRRILRFPFWEDREKCWPLIPGPFPALRPGESRQGVLTMSNFPDGAAVNAVPLAGNRGVLGIRLNWLDAPAAWNDFLNLHVYLAGDAIEPGYDPLVANAQAGRASVVVALADTAGDVAVKTANAIDFIFTAGGGILWQIQHGRIAFNNPQTQLNLISPRTAKEATLQTFSGSMGGVSSANVLASIVPFVFAGLHPAPWVVRGDRGPGLAPPVIE